jgi:uncharacterized protein (DUF2267 family)
MKISRKVAKRALFYDFKKSRVSNGRICAGKRCMKLKHLITEVQKRAHFKSEREVVTALRATLQTFSERLTDAEASRLADQLPKEIADYVLLNQEMPAARPSHKGFFKRIALREGVDLSLAVAHTRAVMEALQVYCYRQTKAIPRHVGLQHFTPLVEMAILGTRWAEVTGILADQRAAA